MDSLRADFGLRAEAAWVWMVLVCGSEGCRLVRYQVAQQECWESRPRTRTPRETLTISLCLRCSAQDGLVPRDCVLGHLREVSGDNVFSRVLTVLKLRSL